MISANLKEEIIKSSLEYHYPVNGRGYEGLFMEWIIRALKKGGKAFIVIPDGILNRIVVTLYMNEPKKSERAEWVHTLFDKTICDVITQSAHIPTHFSPAFDVEGLAEKYKTHPCSEPSMRIIINHRGQYLLCCDDVIGNFGLGTYPEKSLEQQWKEKMEIQSKLHVKGGRKWHSYCESCPRP